MIELTGSYFNPNIECRLYCEMMILNFFGYNFNETEALGYSGGFNFYFAKERSKSNSDYFFSIQGKKPSLLSGLSSTLSGEWYCGYNGSIDEIKIITGEYKLPLIAEVDFVQLTKYYPKSIQFFLSNNLSSVINYGVFVAVPHEVIVVGYDNGNILCVDQFLKVKLEIPEESFCYMWKLPRNLPIENNHTNYKRYYEYAIFPEFNEISFNTRKNSILLQSLINVINNFSFNKELDPPLYDIPLNFAYGYRGIEGFIDTIQQISSGNKTEFSFKLISDLDKQFSKGLYRGHFSNFIRSELSVDYNLTEVSNELNSVSSLWKKIIIDLRKNNSNITPEIKNQWRGTLSKILQMEKSIIEELENKLYVR